MQTLFEQYSALKRRVGGNRELMGYEHSMGMPKEAQQNITPAPMHIVRILSQIEYGIRLSASLDGKYDDLLRCALDTLTDAMDKDGVLTKTICQAAERMLLPMAEEAKAYKLILTGHAHIDMNWMWSWPETVAATIATFTTMLNIMDEYPDFTFSQSQTSVYKIVDDFAPHLKPRIQERIREGRWEVTSSAWVETDKNMPNTESLLRHIGYSKKYLAEHWDIPADALELDFSPDTFGHSANLPEIDLYGGVKYYYHCRGLSGDQALYRWKGQSGKELLVYKEQDWYNSGINPAIAMRIFDISRRCAGLKTGLVLYGVGDHGGGPTRRDVEMALEMRSWPIFPQITFGSIRQFFHEAEAVRDNVPLVEGELNFIFPGCYTTQSRVKLGNRRSEAALAEAETISAFAHIRAGAAIHHDALEGAWQKVLFTHFHDILTGSCVQDSREYAMGLYQEAIAVSQTETNLAMTLLSERIDTSAVAVQEDLLSQSEGAGVGYNIAAFAGHNVAERGRGLTRIWNVFNNTAADKNEPLEITVWDWVGDMRYLKITDGEGNPLEFQKVDGGLQHYWDHKYFRILVQLALPAFSYTTVVLTQGEMGEYPVHFQPFYGSNRNHYPHGNYVLDNGLIRCEFDYSTGEMLSMKDLETGREMLSGRGSLVFVDTQTNGMTAWEIGTYLKETPITDVHNIRPSAAGPLRNGFTFDARIRNSAVTVTCTLDKGAKFVKTAIRADWKEVGGQTLPLLVYRLPLAYDTDRFLYDIPAGSVSRPAAEADRPGNSYVCAGAASGDNAGIIADCKYGFRAVHRDGHAVLYSTLINTAVNPDPYPERGVHDITLSVGLFSDDPAKMALTALSAVRPMAYLSTGSHKGDLPMTGTFCTVDCAGGVPSAVYAEDGALFVRVYSVSD
ncbi:MAG: alpha-mannosidase, partial [Clostridia bacterium]|nr:alpha-mannosidase [Clostridia bacterium]